MEAELFFRTVTSKESWLYPRTGLVNAFLDTFCAGSNFFHQNFWIPSIPGAIQFFRLAISFFIFSSVMTNSLTILALLPSPAFISSIHGIVGFGSFYSQMSPQNSKNLCILGISPSRFSTASRVRKKNFFVSLEHDVMFFPIAFFNVFLQLHLLVTNLIKPLLLNDS